MCQGAHTCHLSVFCWQLLSATPAAAFLLLLQARVMPTLKEFALGANFRRMGLNVNIFCVDSQNGAVHFKRLPKIASFE